MIPFLVRFNAVLNAAMLLAVGWLTHTDYARGTFDWASTLAISICLLSAGMRAKP